MALDNQTAVRLYALACCLVPDPDVASDLFMQSRSEADLRARAARWRRQQGLPDPGLPAAGALPPLGPGEQELALHLARRGQKRRLTLNLFLTLGAVLLLTAGLLGVRALPGALSRGLASDPAFAGSPVGETEPLNGLSFAVYRAEAIPGVTTIWWELTGSGAAMAAETWEAGLRLGRDRTAPHHSQITAYQKNRVLGRSEFSILLPGESAPIIIEGIEERPPTFLLSVLVEHLPSDPTARSYAVRQTLRTADAQVLVDRVLTSPTATTVIINGDPWLPEILADGVLLEPAGIWPQALRRVGEHQVILPPVPTGTKHLELRFPPSDPWIWQPLVYSLPAPGLFLSWHQSQERLAATLSLDTQIHGMGHFVDRTGERFLLNVSPDPGGQNRWRLEAELVDEVLVLEGGQTKAVTRKAGELVQMHLAELKPAPTPTVSLDLLP